MSETSTWTVTGMTCGHCVASVTEELLEESTASSPSTSSSRPAPSPSPAPPRSTARPSRPPSTRRGTRWHEQRAAPRRRLPGRPGRGVRRGLAVGSAVGPEIEPVAGHDGPEGHGASGQRSSTPGSSGEHAQHGGGHGQDGSRSSSTAPESRPGRPGAVTFRLLDGSGAPLTSYDVEARARPAPDRGRDARPHRLPARAPHPATATCGRRGWRWRPVAGGCSPTVAPRARTSSRRPR